MKRRAIWIAVISLILVVAVVAVAGIAYAAHFASTVAQSQAIAQNKVVVTLMFTAQR